MNLVGPDQVLKGVAEVHDGQTFALSLPLDRPRGSLSPHRLPPIIRPTLRAGQVNANCSMSIAYPGASDIVSDDLVVLHTQFSTQWDAFGHIGSRFDADGDGDAEVVYYNGRRGDELLVPSDAAGAGLRSLTDVSGADRGAASTYDAGPVDITYLARHGVQGRAVLVDLEEHYGRARRSVGYADLCRAMEAHGATLETGDLLLLHTGFARTVLAGSVPDDSNAGASLDGTDLELHDFIRDSGVAAIAADNHAVEVFPAVDHRPGEPVLPLHELCLFRLGIHLGELWWLSELAEHLRGAGRTRCLLTAPPLHLPGASGSPVTPIATT